MPRHRLNGCIICRRPPRHLRKVCKSCRDEGKLRPFVHLESLEALPNSDVPRQFLAFCTLYADGTLSAVEAHSSMGQYSDDQRPSFYFLCAFNFLCAIGERIILDIL